MPRFSTFERSVLLPATVPEVYSFHEDPRNITKISPPLLRVGRVECSLPVRAGEEFFLEMSLLGISMEWAGVWEIAEPGTRVGDTAARLVDCARKSPFLYWRHQHLFQPRGSETVMTDRLEYALLGGIPGRLLDATVMRVFFEIMFRARQRATQNYFSSRLASRASG